MFSRLAVPLYLVVLCTGMACALPGCKARWTARQPVAAQRVVKGEGPSWEVPGWGRTRAEAEQDALKKAQALVEVYLRRLDPPVAWTPTAAFIRDNLQRGPAQRKEDLDQELPKDIKIDNRPVKAQCWMITVSIYPQDRETITQMDAQYRSEQKRLERAAVGRTRMLFLGKVLAALSAALLGLLAYIRLDDLTKGYYSRWLAVGACFLALLGAGVWFLR